MRAWLGAGLVSIAFAVLAGCAEERPAVRPADAMAQLRTGLPLLSCRDACVAEWRRAQPEAARLAASGRWPELTALLLRVGYQDDLTLYYLGRAAEGIRYPGAAASYYRQSTYISGTSSSCGHLSGVCGGLSFPQAALLRIAVIERDLNRARLRRVAPASPSSATPQPAADAPEPAATGSEPTPIAPAMVPSDPEPSPPGAASDASPVGAAVSPPPAPAPVPTPRRTGAPASEFIEPPAAR